MQEEPKPNDNHTFTSISKNNIVLNVKFIVVKFLFYQLHCVALKQMRMS